MIITLNISKKELDAIKRNDMRALTTFADLVRYVVSQGVNAEQADKRGFEYYTVVSPPIPLVEDTHGALCVPSPDSFQGTNIESPQVAQEKVEHPEITTEIPDVFKRMIWGDIEGEENETASGV